MGQKKKQQSVKEDVEQDEIFRVFDQGRWKEAKICIACKRQFTWRKKWERCWKEIRTCSDRCKNEIKKERKENDAKKETLNIFNADEVINFVH